MTPQARSFYKNPIFIAVTSGVIMLLIGFTIGQAKVYIGIPEEIRRIDRELREKEHTDSVQNKNIYQLQAENRKYSETIIRMEENQKFLIEKISEINSNLKELRSDYMKGFEKFN